jgi:TPR repeat protein
MPFMRQVRAPYAVNGTAGEGIAAEFTGIFPDNEAPSYFLVLCLLTETVAISFTVTASVPGFESRQELYRNLIENNLQVYDVINTGGEGTDLTPVLQAARGGDAEAQYVLGSTFARGHGVGASPEEALRWYREAARQGHTLAQVALGTCYANGTGTTTDPAAAVACWEKAALKGNADAQFYLAMAYSQGCGVQQNNQQAVAHCQLSAEQGHEQAAATLRQLMS